MIVQMVQDDPRRERERELTWRTLWRVAVIRGIHQNLSRVTAGATIPCTGPGIGTPSSQQHKRPTSSLKRRIRKSLAVLPETSCVAKEIGEITVQSTAFGAPVTEGTRVSRKLQRKQRKHEKDRLRKRKSKYSPRRQTTVKQKLRLLWDYSVWMAKRL